MKMKQIITLVVLVILYTSTFAQSPYKKAGLLNKLGRTYELGALVSKLGKSTNVANGLFLGIGIDYSNKKMMWGNIFEYIRATKFSTSILTNTNQTKIITGKTPSILNIKYSFAYKLSKYDQNEKKNVQPYLFTNLIGVIVLKRVEYTSDISNISENDNPTISNFHLGLDFGGGALYHFKENLAMNVMLGTQLVQKKLNLSGGDTNPNDLIDSHIFFNIGLRYAFRQKD
jgi:hypothetical protein